MESKNHKHAVINGINVMSFIATEAHPDKGYLLVALAVSVPPDDGRLGDTKNYQDAMLACFGDYSRVESVMAQLCAESGLAVCSYFGERFGWETKEQFFQRVFSGLR